MNFLERILRNLADEPTKACLIEVHGDALQEHDGKALLTDIQRARGFLASAGVSAGDRVGLLATNSAQWVCSDLAIIASGAIVVPLYDKQEPRELASVLRSAEPKILLVGTQELATLIAAAWPQHCPIATLEEVFRAEPTPEAMPTISPDDAVAIIFTSGTSGEPKGVTLTRANVDFMIPKTIERIDRVIANPGRVDRVFHFLPLCFAASRMMLWTQMSRPNPLMLSTDITNLAQEMKAAAPNYFLNVPAVLERIKHGVTANLTQRGGLALKIYQQGVQAAKNLANGRGGALDRIKLGLAERVVFRKIRDKIGPNLEFLISGSAPLSEDTQRWFQMLGIQVFQAYGLTETTGIVSLDDPAKVVPGRVGVPLSGVETRVADDGELLVRGPNIFAGYWRNPKATAAAIQDGWFHTGDQVEIDANNNLKIIGRVKNLIIPESGHNIAPEPLEEKFLAACPEATQCMVVGHGRAFVAIMVPPGPSATAVEKALNEINAELPAYRRIRLAIPIDKAFSVEGGQLTANQKLRRTVIEREFEAEISAAYERARAERQAQAEPSNRPAMAQE